MAQIFHRSTNTISRVSEFGGAAVVVVLVATLAAINRSSYVTEVGVARNQPVQFSHKQHVSDDGIDCRYCHTSVEKSSFAGIPSTKICMSCHTQIWAESPILEPVRESLRTGKSLEWTRVHDLPGFVYFNHSIHINKGIGCQSCHGRVDLMPMMWKVNNLMMGWCLDCHRAPEKFIRPREAVFQMDYQYPPNQLEVGRKLMAEYKVQKLT